MDSMFSRNSLSVLPLNLHNTKRILISVLFTFILQHNSSTMIMQGGTGHYLNHLEIKSTPITLKHVNTNFFMLIFSVMMDMKTEN